MHLLPESDVFREAMSGDSSARRELLGKYRPLLRLIAARHARRVVSHRFDESDVVQLTFAEALRTFPSFRGASREELAAWLQSILENNLVRLWRNNAAAKRDYRREFARGDRADDLSFAWCAAPTDSPARNLLRGEIALLLAQALEHLPHEYRVAVEQRFIDGRRMREIAEQLETSVGVVAGRLRRGLELLRDRLPDELQEFLEGGC